jgi:hypothetical protein
MENSGGWFAGFLLSDLLTRAKGTINQAMAQGENCSRSASAKTEQAISGRHAGTSKWPAPSYVPFRAGRLGCVMNRHRTLPIVLQLFYKFLTNDTALVHKVRT